MIFAVTQPVDVHVSNGSILGPILVAVGALAAAILTVATANWRQAKQLEHDRQLQNNRLDRDRELRQIDVMHDRRMRHRSRAEETIDEALAQQSRYRETFNEMERALEDASIEGTEPGGPLPPEAGTVLFEKVSRVWEETSYSHDQSVRLVIRLGVTPLVEAHTAIAERTKEAVRSQRMEVGRSDSEKQAFADAVEKVEDAHAAFQVAALVWNFSLIKERSDKASE